MTSPDRTLQRGGVHVETCTDPSTTCPGVAFVRRERRPRRWSRHWSAVSTCCVGCQSGVFTGRAYTRLVRSYGLKQEFMTPHCRQQNGMVERLIRTLKEQCVHRHHFETQQHAMRLLSDWIRFYNHRRPH